ncbi:hypothetical protein [uncultured Tateyamaria sp.]|uniref:hypothetical protein n=1 Tax=uncultured Tateyamaria sp. TaxID=455651 RepID=UPI00260E177E|nr:hypothetical protein [uncultured Tateyamaria sp.]
MPLVPDTEHIAWYTGDEVEAQKSLLRQTDATFLMQILQLSLKLGGPLHNVALAVQKICDQARQVVAGDIPLDPFTTELTSIWIGYDEEETAEFSANVRLIAGLNLMKDASVINPLALGDFCRAFADLATSVPAEKNAGLHAIGGLIKSLQNKQAFDTTTNRIRIKRRDILEQVPGVGITQWYLPSDDVLGTIDRLLGYYETGDISGTTTDGLAVLATLQTLNVYALGNPVAIKPKIATLVNNGLAFNSFAGMVIQMHHSLPECMMAINLMPRNLGGVGGAISQIYSPLLTNTFPADPGINAIYTSWQQARYTALGGDGARGENMRMLIVLQDIFQMPKMASASNEVALVMPFTFADMTNSPSVFGEAFYNKTVTELNTSNPGPAITLEKLSKPIFTLWFVIEFNPAINKQPYVSQSVQRGMTLPVGTPPDVANYNELVAPFLEQADYGRVKAAEVGVL